MSLRALDHHWCGLFQYAAIRVGTERAARLLSRLAATIEAEGHSGPAAAARPWRAFYRQLRALCAAAEPATTPVRCYFRGSDGARAKQLARLRHALSPLQAEVAELLFARALDLADVAAIMGIELQAAAAYRDQAVATARTICRAHTLPAAERFARVAFLEAFSLDPNLTPAPPRRNRTPIVGHGDVVAGRYEIEALLGSGAFADVYRARDRDVEGHTVALKISRTVCLDERSVQIALRELQLLASVFHPSVVQLKDHGWHNNRLWFVMPLYRGETLAERLRRGPLRRAEAKAIFKPLAEALATMHRAGVLHQDIKPDNILLAELDPSGAADEAAGTEHPRAQGVLPVLLDLGLAARDAEIVLAGTPAYLAPEVAARFAGLPDPALVGPKADVFGLALTLRDALDPDAAGEAPLASVDAFVAQRAAKGPEPPAARSLRDLRGAFARWLHLCPDRRPTAAELCRELSQLTAPQERAARRMATLRWSVPTAVASVCVFGVVVYGLSQEATMQRMEAENARFMAAQAKERVALANADLAVQEARSRKLEANIARLEQDYRQSRLTRDQLASRLARAESELRASADRIARQQRRLAGLQQQQAAAQQDRARLRKSLTAEREQLGHAQRQLERSRARLEREREHAEEQAEQRSHLEQRIVELELALEHARAQLAQLKRQTRTQVSAATWR